VTTVPAWTRQKEKHRHQSSEPARARTKANQISGKEFQAGVPATGGKKKAELTSIGQEKKVRKRRGEQHEK